jgi:hypothetical protein
MIKDIMDVPFPLAASRRLINFFTFHISMFFSASLACGALIATAEGLSGHLQ